MFDFDIVLTNKSDENNLFMRIPLYFYIIFFVVSLLLFFTIIFYGASFFSYLFLFISVSALTYRETWIFSKGSKNVLGKSGIGFIYKNIKFKFNDIELLELVSFIKGRNSNIEKNSKFILLNKRYYSIKLHISNGKSYTLLTVTESKKNKLDIIFKELEKMTLAKTEK